MSTVRFNFKYAVSCYRNDLNEKVKPMPVNIYHLKKNMAT